MNKTTCGISVIIKATGMKRKDILTHIEIGNIAATKRREQFVFEVSEKNRLTLLHETYIGFFLLARQYADSKCKFSFEKRACRDELIEFMKSNAWFGADAVPAKEVFFADIGSEAYFVRKTDESLLASNIRLWIASYGENSEQKLRLLISRTKELYPATGMLLGKFLVNEYPSETTAAWILTDFLCSSLQCEITQATEDMLEFLAASADKNFR